MEAKTKRFRFFSDLITMSKRSILMSKRNPDVILVSLIVPVLVMLLFVYVMGGAMNVGSDVSYINYVLPGIIVLCLGQGAATTAITVSTDNSKGIISRFRTMPIAKSSVLFGYVAESVLRKSFTSLIVILLSFVIGFRPSADFTAWLVFIGILFLCCLMFAWIAVLFGLLANSPEGAGAFSMLATVLPYFSSGFAPTDSMPKALRTITENQPITPIIEAMRGLLLGTDTGNNVMLAVFWCAAILVIASIAALRTYQNKVS